jgi:threonylcarbamoyladenosine tRNA methylthiotransferase MtaB
MHRVTFSTQFLGCKVSRVDSEAIGGALAAAGGVEVERGDLHVVNGCCVTAEAVAKTRQAVRRALAAGATQVVVTGCAARLGVATLGGPDPRVTVVGETAEATPAAVTRIAARLGCLGGPVTAPAARRIRAFLRVQDGCSFACSFCVIPQVRGRTRSRPVEAIAEEARRRAAAGTREAVLTGVNIGLYRDGSRRLADVVRAVAATPGLERIRISSIEVQHVTADLLAAVADGPRVLPHLHVPLQSGDDAVLRAMRRRYTAGAYLERIAAARAAIPGLNLTADVIVGFPDEDERAFRQTAQVAAAAGTTRLHVFPYSPRPGTRTHDADPIPAAVKRHRSLRLRQAAEERGTAYREGRIGSVDEVLVETIGEDGVASGYARDYTTWRVADAAARAGDVVRAIATGVAEGAIEARMA